MISVLLIGAAAACVVVGILSGSLVFTFVALGLAVLTVALFAATILRERRAAAAGGGVDGDETTTSDQLPASDESTAEACDDTEKEAKGAAESEPAISAVSAAPEPAGDTVYVIPGRKRYHLAGCHILDVHDREELTPDEAHEEGFTPCTSCAPARPVSRAG